MYFLMKILFSLLVILLGYCCIWAQDDKSDVVPPVIKSIENSEVPPSTENAVSNEIPVNQEEQMPVMAETSLLSDLKDFPEAGITETRKPFTKGKPEKITIFDETEKTDDSITIVEEKFHWKPALKESAYFLGIQHVFRMTQPKTRRELGGPFFADWGRSIRSLHGWDDGNKFFTNYVAHPLQGGVTGRIFINNSDRAKKQEFGKSLKYWETRLKAMVWSAVWSAQFELGPVSEATLGNVGINDHTGYNKMAWVDLVITPVVGTGIVVAEDAVDKYILKNWLERKTKNRNMIKLYRVVFTPTTGFSNILRGKMPWHRDDRLIGIGRNTLSN